RRGSFVTPLLRYVAASLGSCDSERCFPIWSVVPGRERLFNPFTRFQGKLAGRNLLQRFRVFVSGLMEKTNLPPVTAAPFAEHQVQLQTELPHRAKWLFQSFRLEPGGLATRRREDTEPSFESCQCASD
ncbi:MAG TPA: hypothetical protein VKA67_07365, partial [Verrucomicrobiae bacterium]|nr:hypothetical protein [Verrucomicrobiae bacterium]